MNALPLVARWYVGLVSAAGGLLIACAVPLAAVEPVERLLYAAMLGVIYGAAEAWEITIPRRAGDQPHFTLATAVAIWGVLTLSPVLTVLVVVVGFAVSLLYKARSGRPWYKHSFNLGQLVISYGVTSCVYWALAEPAEPVLGSVRNTLAFLPVFLVYYALNTALVSAILAMVRQERLLDVWRHHYKDTALIDLAMVPAGAILALLSSISPFALLLAGLPLYVVHKCFQYIKQMHEQTRKSLLALSRTLDHRDTATYHHSETVAGYARVIAERLGLPPAQIELIVEAARLHDIGKIGVRDDILLKAGPLTAEERREMERHPEIGAELIESFSVFQEGLAMIRHHHERWDGRGYPTGLAAEEIPIGARVIFVADSFEAMTADRPYRKGMPIEVAAQRLLEGSGTQWDPRVVEIMLDWLAEAHGLRVHRVIEPDPVPQTAATVQTITA